jgi:hypothetical protein
MEKDEVTCPECGLAFPGKHLLDWHRNSVHRQIAGPEVVRPSGDSRVSSTEGKSESGRVVKGPSGSNSFMKRELKPHYMDPRLMVSLGVVLIAGGIALTVWSFKAYHWGYSLIGVNGLWTGWVLLKRGWRAAF